MKGGVRAGFEDVDFRGAAAFAGSGMVFAWASAGGEPLAGKIGCAVRHALVGGDALIAGIIGVRPETFSGGFVAWTAEIAHCPGTRPET